MGWVDSRKKANDDKNMHKSTNSVTLSTNLVQIKIRQILVYDNFTP